MRVYFATHATTYDNERGIASGRRDAGLSPAGRAQARVLAEALRDCPFDLVCCSPLSRARETAAIAFEGRPVLVDERLSEIDYGVYTGQPVAEIDRLRAAHIAGPFSGGESYEQRLAHVRAFLEELSRDRPACTPLIIGHRATLYCLRVIAGRGTFEEMFAAPFVWQPLWTFDIDSHDAAGGA